VPILGRPLGKLVSLTFIVFFLHVNALNLRVLSEQVNITMPETPILVFVVSFLAASSYAVRKGLENLARVNELLGPLFLIGGLVVFVLAAKDMDFRNWLPVLGNGLKPPLKGSLLPASFFGVCIVMAVFMPYHNRPERTLAAKALGVVIGVSYTTLLTMGALAHFGVAQTIALQNPIFILSRDITIAGFLERVEAVFLAIWVGGGFVTVSALQYACCLGLAQWLGLRDYRPLVLPVGVMMAALSLSLFGNTPERSEFTRNIYPLYALSVEGGLTTVLLAVALLRGKGKG